MKSRSFSWMVGLLPCLFFLFFSCQKEKKETPGQIALECYQNLISGNYDAYLKVMANYEQMPSSYREELKMLLTQYIRNELVQRGGITKVTISSDTVIGNRANVFLQLEYKDGTSEEISVPMIYIDQVWRLQ